MSNFTKSPIRLMKGKVLCSIHFWQKRKLILINNKEIFVSKHLPNQTNENPNSPFILSTLIMRSLNEGGNFPFDRADIFQDGKRTVGVHNLSQKIDLDPNNSSFLEIDPDPANSSRLEDTETARGGVYSSENENEEENNFNRDEYFSLPARKWEVKIILLQIPPYNWHLLKTILTVLIC